MTNTVYFANSGFIDLDVIRIMGVSVKETDSPIGYFGTGLKFAIATLLRFNHEVTVWRDGVPYQLTKRDTTIRGKPAEQVYLGEEGLSFTTSLGRNWQVWQAYRELHSNMLDEAGEVSDRPLENDTVIEIKGNAFYNQYLDRHKIFVDPQETPLVSSGQIEVYDRESEYFYYRGVRAGAVPGSEKTRLTYNIMSEMTLTEDRTFGSLWDLEWKLQSILPKLASSGLANGLLSGTEYWDQSLELQVSGASEEFTREASRLASDAGCGKNARRIFQYHQKTSASWSPIQLDDEQSKALMSSIVGLTEGLNCDLSPEEVQVTTTLGPNVMGLYHDETDQIWLAVHTFDYGPRFLMAVLYEEWLHKRHGYGDKTRSLQSFLLHRLVAETCNLKSDSVVPQDSTLAKILKF